MRLGQSWIESRIPHKGTMCLLYEVLHWNAERISCRSVTHRDPQNPLRSHGQLGAACGVEYAAQAMAVHGALAASLKGVSTTTSSAHDMPTQTTAVIQAPLAGFLASVRGVRIYVERLDDLGADLISNAQRIAGDAHSALYEFELRADSLCVLSGRATVVLDAGSVVA